MILILHNNFTRNLIVPMPCVPQLVISQICKNSLFPIPIHPSSHSLVAIPFSMTNKNQYHPYVPIHSFAHSTFSSIFLSSSLTQNHNLHITTFQSSMILNKIVLLILPFPTCPYTFTQLRIHSCSLTLFSKYIMRITHQFSLIQLKFGRCDHY